MPSNSVLTGLEEDIQRLEELDRFRSQFLTWRDLGRDALKQLVGCLAPAPTDASGRLWNLKLDTGDKALVVKALCRPGGDTNAFEVLVDDLRKSTLEQILGNAHDGPLYTEDHSSPRLLDAALALDALSSAPKAVFTPATMLYYYAVIRELYYPTPPVWVVGGARAGTGGRPSAFTTTQFVRGILSFARMLERTGAYLEALAELQQTPKTGVAAWDNQDAQRRALSLHTTLAHRAWNLAFSLDEPVPRKFDGTALPEFEAAIQHDLISALATSIDTFTAARDAAKEYRRDERAAAAGSPGRQHLLDRSEGAHAIALKALDDAIERSQKAKNLFPGPLPNRTTLLNGVERKEFAARLMLLKQQFDETATQVRGLVNPALDYLSTVLDHELALATATSETVAVEAMELASAAATLGAAGKRWDDERLLRAAQFLASAMTPEGFNIARPFHTGGGSYYQPTQPQILGAYAQILEHVEADLSPTILSRIVRYFDQTQGKIDTNRSSWRWAHAAPTWKHSPFHTAVATIALDRLCRMLDRRINNLVLRHFSYKEPQPKALRIQELFYPDYGLATVMEGDRRIPIAIALERMRAHVAGVELTGKYKDRLYSVVFHGPPGTGKTTLLEALAASASVPLIEVTPSDIVVRGTDAIEARARAVLRALSFVTRAVVIFDEFDPVLRTRETGPDEKVGPQSIFNFLTPSMLPKLKTLYEAAKTRGVAFALVTNAIKVLDPAAIRTGRFDATIGVYPPDALSRYGRLFTEVQAFVETTKPAVPADFNDRFRKVVEDTRGASMQQVGLPGWFTRPRGAPREETIFGYLFTPNRPPNGPRIGKGEERRKGDDARPGQDMWSPEEKEQWEMIEALERQAKTKQTPLGKEIWKGVDAAFRS